MLDVAIINLKLSNLHSVSAACRKVGLKSKVTSDKIIISKAKAIILPGVGSFSEAMTRIKKLNLEEVIKSCIDKGKPFLGICLGMQVLFSKSEEFGNSKGLSIFKGDVKKFTLQDIKNVKYPVPHVGWSKIFNNSKNEEIKKTLFKSLKKEEFMYFVHSYFVVPKDEKIISSKTKYGKFEFCSSVCSKNLVGVQFHPEKSGLMGLKIYKNFKNLIKKANY